MKLSAPPPPPPEPPEPNQPTPDANTPSETPPPSDANSPATAPKALAWPAWFPGADFLLAVLAVMLAFLVSSFVARNPDLWLHLAAGKRLLAGEYRPGTDPFSYSAADRPWVNHSLLFDVGVYLLYSGKGALLVVMKALAVAAAFALLIGIRRSPYALWPWAAVAVVAVLAAAPRMTLTPLVGSVFLLAVTMLLLFRMPHRPNSWRFPIAIGITFWIWANVDQWFFIGPLALALVLAGELIQRKVWKQSDDANADAGPLGRLPDVPTLAKALGIGIVACMLNPHHVRIWELPFELVGASGVKDDPQFRIRLYAPIDHDYTAATGLGRAMGYNHVGLAYAALFVGGGLVLGLGFGRVRLAHFALWVGFALLSLTSIYAIPFFAVVAVPIIASQLNGLSERMTLKSWGDPKSRFLLLGSAAGRVVCLVGTLVACVLAWPGWLHPDVGSPAFAKRVAWAVQPDPAMVKAAEQLQAWREEGKLPADVRGFIASVDLANYCAWYAPLEKVYFNGRYSFHRPELPTIITVRSGMGIIRQDSVFDSQKNDEQIRKMEEEFRKLGIEYVAVSGSPGTGSGEQNGARNATIEMFKDTARWSPWYLDGRSTVSGWRAEPGAERPTFAALRIDSVALAFGKKAERLARGTVTQIPAILGWEDEFFRGVGVAPAGADAAMGWRMYSLIIQEQQKLLDEKVIGPWLLSPSSMGMSFHRLACLRSTPGRPTGRTEDMATAVALLTLRAARQAIAADPDHPDGYYALAIALRDGNLPLSQDERAVSQAIALRQFLMRLPPPERYRKGLYLSSPTQAAYELTSLYLGAEAGSSRFLGMPVKLSAFQILSEYGATRFLVEMNGQLATRQITEINQGSHLVGGPYLMPLDLAHDTLLLAEKYVPYDSADEKDARAKSDKIREWLKPIEDQLGRANNAYENAHERMKLSGRTKLSDQVGMALRNNLVGEALRLLSDKDTDLQKEFGPKALQASLARIALEMAVGRLEDAATDLTFRASEFDEIAAQPQMKRDLHVDELRPLLRELTYQKLVFEGNYAEAGEILERSATSDIGKDPSLPPELTLIFKKPSNIVAGRAVIPELQMFSQFAGSPLEVIAQQHTLKYMLANFVTWQQILNNRRSRDMEFFWRRGVLSLLEGDIAMAKKRFEDSRQPGVPEWGIPEYRHQQAERYLRLIGQAEKTEKAAQK